MACRRCPRLVKWCRAAAREKVRRYQEEPYWGKPVPGFGDSRARLLIVGLAPAAHGANRTGRMFTGDRSGDWLFKALYRVGFANQPHSRHIGDGLKLYDCYVSAVLHCAPPNNKPLPQELENCASYLIQEIEALPRLRVILALGRIAFDQVLRIYRSKLAADLSPCPRFQHGAEVLLGRGTILLASYHPSQQNTFTGRLREEMFYSIFNRVRVELGESR